jgi:hypothetical protein
MKRLRVLLAVALVAMLALPASFFAASHREAPITAIDRLADITDFFAFVSYDDPNKVTLILCVDPFLEPSNGPNYFPFDPDILYEIKIDNNNDAVADLSFQFRFTTEVRAPGVFTGFVGAFNGINAPPTSPKPIAPGTPLIPAAITALDGSGSEGLSLRQSYSVTMVKGGTSTVLGPDVTKFAVPSNAGPRTMPSYSDLAKQGIYNLGDGVKVFAGTVDDPFWIDLGAAFDSLNFRSTGFPAPGVLSAAQDADDTHNYAPDAVSGYNVNAIAIEVPIAMINSVGAKVAANHPAATIGAWGVTSRPRVKVQPTQAGGPITLSTDYAQIQRMGNPLFNELIIGTGFKDKWSMSQPKDDAQFANFALDPLLARVFNAVYAALLKNPAAVLVPPPPRTDLLPLVQYTSLHTALGGASSGDVPAGPVADLLRLNTGIPSTPAAKRKRLGLLAGDLAGWPNGRRLLDDVTDIASRAVAGVLAGPPYNGFPNNSIGDGVNTNDAPYQETFPYLAWAWSGRDSHHTGPGQPGCGGTCPTQ